MQVKSPIADMNIDIKSVSIEGTYIVVKSNPETSLETTVHVSPIDFWAFFKAMFTSLLLVYIITYPVQYMLFKMGIGKRAVDASTAGEKHPTSNPW